MISTQEIFFALSDKEKISYSKTHQVPSFGYSAVVNLKEYFQVRIGGKDSKLKYPVVNDFDFGKCSTDCYKLLDIFGRKILDDMINDLDLDRKYIEELLDPFPIDLNHVDIVRDGDFVYTGFLPPDYVSSSNLDLFIYNNLDAYNEKWTSNHPAHVDSGIITLIPCSNQGALEFKDQTLNAWVAVEQMILDHCKTSGESNYSYIIIMTGETLEKRTESKLKSGLHRVRRMKENEGKRYSAVHKLRSKPSVTGARYEQDYILVGIQENSIENLKNSQVEVIKYKC